MGDKKKWIDRCNKDTTELHKENWITAQDTQKWRKLVEDAKSLTWSLKPAEKKRALKSCGFYAFKQKQQTDN